jgi:hypothetical protein
MSYQDFPPALLTLSPRLTRDGDPAASVVGINTTPLPDGALVYCIENQSPYRFNKQSAASPDGTFVLAPTTGPGRWLVATGLGSPITDEVNATLVYDPANGSPGAAGDFYIVTIAGAESLFVDLASPQAALVAVINGPRTRAGRIGKARLGLLVDQTSVGNGNVILQWYVNTTPVGNPVTLVWSTGIPCPDINNATFAQVLAANAAAAEVDFGNVSWKAGDTVYLRANVGAPVAGAGAIIPFVYETIFA